jgi:class 3 adenylate cyclase
VDPGGDTELTPTPAAAQRPVSLRDLIAGDFRTLTLGGISTLLALTVLLVLASGKLIDLSVRETILVEAEENIAQLTRKEASLRNDLFVRIGSFARLLQREQESILAHPDLHVPPRGPITLQRASNGSAFKVENNGGASVYLPARPPLDDALRRFATLTESFDPLMQSVLTLLPETITAVYFNSSESLNRYLPYIDNVSAQFDPSIDVRSFNFYYVADEAHNPAGGPKWTEAYLDPAGQGWMISCAVPIRLDGKLRGVTGIDVNLDQLRKSVVELPLPAKGAAMLIAADGQLLAASKALEKLLGLKELRVQDYGSSQVAHETLKPKEFHVQRSAAPDLRDFFTHVLREESTSQTVRTTLEGQEFIVSHGAVAEPGWRLFVFTPTEELLTPLFALRRRSVQLVAAEVVVFGLVMLLVTLLILRRASRLARSIAAPLQRLSEQTSVIGTTAPVEEAQPVGIDELDTLSGNFGRMASELAARQQAALEAEVALEVKKRSEELLQKVMPKPIVDRMMAGEGVIADAHDAVTVVFADVVNFTPLAAERPPREVVRLLETLFGEFDDITKRLGVEKIKTIGDAYMVVAGVPFSRPDHAAAAVRVALEMQRAAENLESHEKMQLRIGIHSGPAVAGVIGRDKFLYDLWGDTVNIASRLESQGLPGRIQITDEVRRQLPDGFLCEPRGIVQLKGRGPTMTYWVVGEQLQASGAAAG